jgi:phenylacetate-CoA ligase
METMGRDDLLRLQEERLKKLVRYSYDNVPIYRRKFKDAGVEPGDIKTLEDAGKIPFTYKDDLRDSYPFGMFSVPLDRIIRVHASSGTTGNPTVVGYTQEDLDVWTEMMARCMVATGCTDKDVVQVSYGYGLFTGGLGLHYGSEKVGATVVPASGGNTKRQLKLIQDFGTTIIACTPSFGLYLSEVAKSMGQDLVDSTLKIGIMGAEPWSEGLRQRIEEALGMKAYDIYGMSELCGPGVSVECEAQNGLHIWGDHFLVETIDPVTEEVLEPGSKGELVFTPLTKYALPFIRYRTRDISIIDWEECQCGRCHPRMMRVMGRSDDMLIIRGVNVFPSQIEHTLMGIEGVGDNYQITLTKKGPMDVVSLEVEVTSETFSDKMGDMVGLKNRIENELRSDIGISILVKLVGAGSIPRSEGKAKRVVDLREE